MWRRIWRSQHCSYCVIQRPRSSSPMGSSSVLLLHVHPAGMTVSCSPSKGMALSPAHGAFRSSGIPMQGSCTSACPEGGEGSGCAKDGSSARKSEGSFTNYNVPCQWPTRSAGLSGTAISEWSCTDAGRTIGRSAKDWCMDIQNIHRSATDVRNMSTKSSIPCTKTMYSVHVIFLSVTQQHQFGEEPVAVPFT